MKYVLSFLIIAGIATTLFIWRSDTNVDHTVIYETPVEKDSSDELLANLDDNQNLYISLKTDEIKGRWALERDNIEIILSKNSNEYHIRVKHRMPDGAMTDLDTRVVVEPGERLLLGGNGRSNVFLELSPEFKNDQSLF